MPKLLSADAVEKYKHDGYYFPVDILSEAETRDLRRRLEVHEAEMGGPIQGDRRHKAHLYLTWLNDLIRHPRILDAVEDLIGPDIRLFHLTVWPKDAQSGAYVSWHQDATYFGLEPLDNVTVWVALSRADSQAGCMRVLPKSHKQGQLPVRLEPVKDNLLSSGQHVVQK